MILFCFGNVRHNEKCLIYNSVDLNEVFKLCANFFFAMIRFLKNCWTSGDTSWSHSDECEAV
jgi:hypothetical protein